MHTQLRALAWGGQVRGLSMFQPSPPSLLPGPRASCSGGVSLGLQEKPGRDGCGTDRGFWAPPGGHRGWGHDSSAAQHLWVSVSLCDCFCLYLRLSLSVSKSLLPSVFLLSVSVSLCSSVSSSMDLHLSLSFSLQASSPLPEPKSSPITEPGASNYPSLCILCALSPMASSWHFLPLIGCRYDSVQVGCDNQPHQPCLPATPTSYVLVFGEGTSCLEEHVGLLLCLCPNRACRAGAQRMWLIRGCTGRGD